MNFQRAEFRLACGKVSQLPKHEQIEIAFIGRSNVGKSTLINRLVARKALARVSSVPGKTATINFYDVDGIAIVDLPGYGYAKTSKSELERLRRLIYGYLQGRDNLHLVVQLIDMRHAPSQADLQMINSLIDMELPFLIVFTKCDKLNKSEAEARWNAFHEEIPEFTSIHSIRYSAVTQAGIAELRAIIEDIAQGDEEISSESDLDIGE